VVASQTSSYTTLKLIAAAIIIPAVAFVLCTLLKANYDAHRLLYSGCRGERDSLEAEGYTTEPVTIRSRDGITLEGWYSPGSAHPEIAIVVLPGQGGNTCYALPEAKLLADAGYSTLVFEHRTCKDPMLPATAGVHEARDLRGAVDYLASRPDVEHIGVLGFTEGGTASILAAAEDARIEAVVSVGSYATLEDRLLEPDPNADFYDRLLRRVTLWFIEREGIPLDEARPVDVVGKIAPRPLLLIHAGCDELDGLRLMEAASPESTELWIAEDAGRGGLAQFDPVAYTDRVTRFFDAAFGVTNSRAAEIRPSRNESAWETEPTGELSPASPTR